jgi:uncharacterized protein YbjT (DUF2867 family)
MKDLTATIIGATGLIGSHLVELTGKDPAFKRVKVVVRRPLALENPKMEVIVLDFSDASAFRSAIEGSDAVFCAVGTTQKKVKGDKAAYRSVDYEIPVNAAKYCSETGCSRFLLVSSVGADSKSSNFYLSLKGEVEDMVNSIRIPSVSIFRPSMLIGKRKEFRFGELLGKFGAVPFSFLIPSKFKPISARKVAEAMVAASKLNRTGLSIYFHKEMLDII